MQKLLAAMFVALLMVGCGEEPGGDSPESNQKSGETSPVKSPEIVKIDLDDNETRNKIIDEAMWVSWAFELSLTERIRNEMMTAEKNGEVLSVRGKKGEELCFLPNKITPYTGWSKYVDDGRTTVAQIKDGQAEGLSAAWYENGQKEREVNLKDGKLDGFSTRWYENGQKKSESSYKDGKLVTAVVWKPNGEKCPETNVVNGNGFWLTYSWRGQTGRSTYEDGIEVYRGYDGTFVVRTEKKADDEAPLKTNANTQFFEESDSLIKSISNLDEIIEEAIDSQKIRHEGNDEKRLTYVAYGSLQQTPYSGWVKKLYFRPNGQLQSLAQLKNGKADGLAFFWYRNGQLQLEGKYKDGKLSTAVAWKHNGEKCPDTNLKNGNGVVVRYSGHRGGAKRATYKDGKIVRD